MDESSVTFQSSVSGPGEFGLCIVGFIDRFCPCEQQKVHHYHWACHTGIGAKISHTHMGSCKNSSNKLPINDFSMSNVMVLLSTFNVWLVNNLYWIQLKFNVYIGLWFVE